MFIHGVESGPEGPKVRMMTEQGLDVVAPNQHMSKRRLDRRNSVVRQVLRLGEFRFTVGLGLVGLGLIALHPAGGLLVGAAGLTAALRGKRWVSQALAASRRVCTAIAAEALAANEIDVIVGSSWGAAIACELIDQGMWAGPTVLLAPATRKVQCMIDPTGWPTLRAAIQASPGPIHMFHDPADDVIPVDGSRDLVGGCATLTELETGGHLVLPFVEDGRLVSLVRSLA